eukprot:3236787-Rhodomonas_salina.1
MDGARRLFGLRPSPTGRSPVEPVPGPAADVQRVVLLTRGRVLRVVEYPTFTSLAGTTKVNVTGDRVHPCLRGVA